MLRYVSCYPSCQEGFFNVEKQLFEYHNWNPLEGPSQGLESTYVVVMLSRYSTLIAVNSLLCKNYKAFIFTLWPFCHLTFRHETHIKSPDFDLKIKWSLTRSHCFSRFTYNFSIAELTLAVTVKIPCPDCMSKTIDPKESLVKPKSLKSKQWGLFSSHIITWEENIHVRLWRKSKPPLQSVNPLLLSKCFGERKKQQPSWAELLVCTAKQK